jgi:Lar family restriction alleviation protein
MIDNDNTVEFEIEVDRPTGRPFIPIPEVFPGHYRVTLTRLDEPLEPCPFCGSTSPNVGVGDRGENFALRHYVTCQGCGGEGPSETTEAAAIDAWNRRASIPEIAKRQESESRYPMCADQHVQVDCRRTKCRYHRPGKCANVSPAITLGEDGAGRCWSYKPA